MILSLNEEHSSRFSRVTPTQRSLIHAESLSVTSHCSVSKRHTASTLLITCPRRGVFQEEYSRVAYIYVRSRAKCLKFRTTTSKINILGKLLMQQKYYFIQEM